MFALGILLVEIFSRTEPYPGKKALQSRNFICDKFLVAPAVASGELTHSIPDNTPDVFSEIMKACWAFESINRPDMKTIIEKVEAIEAL